MAETTTRRPVPGERTVRVCPTHGSLNALAGLQLVGWRRGDAPDQLIAVLRTPPTAAQPPQPAAPPASTGAAPAPPPPPSPPMGAPLLRDDDIMERAKQLLAAQQRHRDGRRASLSAPPTPPAAAPSPLAGSSPFSPTGVFSRSRQSVQEQLLTQQHLYPHHAAPASPPPQPAGPTPYRPSSTAAPASPPPASFAPPQHHHLPLHAGAAPSMFAPPPSERQHADSGGAARDGPLGRRRTFVPTHIRPVLNEVRAQDAPLRLAAPACRRSNRLATHLLTCLPKPPAGRAGVRAVWLLARPV